MPGLLSVIGFFCPAAMTMIKAKRHKTQSLDKYYTTTEII